MTENRITPEAIEAEIVDESFYVFPRTTVTVCALTLQNGYVVIGHSAAVDPANFDETIGQNVARADAKEKISPLLGFRLRDFMHSRSSGR